MQLLVRKGGGVTQIKIMFVPVQYERVSYSTVAHSQASAGAAHAPANNYWPANSSGSRQQGVGAQKPIADAAAKQCAARRY